MENKYVMCDEHGEQQATYVCQHLADSIETGNVVGYFCSTESPDNPRPDAWCIECEEYYQEIGCWNDQTEKFAGITLLCGRCYDKAKKMNGGFN